MVISVSHLSKYYQIHKKEPGLVGSLKSLISRKYDTVKAVDDISLEIKEGELVGFIGPNGAGKTTTLKCLSGLLYPNKGRVEVLGNNPYDKKAEFLKQISLVMGQ
ncbi:ATP-binding cassette domain-containing protein, partial [Candidatus Microgenomates bacterium]|nr:ATP-binding cassette domain-containing protein [Candidatus Microgenomates bacterium]